MPDIPDLPDIVYRPPSRRMAAANRSIHIRLQQSAPLRQNSSA
jgi:hypothetical protein